MPEGRPSPEGRDGKGSPGPLCGRPTVADVAKRLGVLRYVVSHALTTPLPDDLAEWTKGWPAEQVQALWARFDERRDEICASVRSVGLWDVLTPQERAFLSTRRTRCRFSPCSTGCGG